MKWLIITPAKNEADYIEGLIQSMLCQQIRPAAWVIVDDGSTDGMADVVAPYAEKYEWLHCLRKPTKAEQRSGGSKVVKAFYYGYERFKDIAHDGVMKLDGDLTLPCDYLASLQEAFMADPKLGLCGGYCVIPEGEEWKEEVTAAHHVRGALKGYRRACFEDIGGFTETWNWDGLDNMMVMHKGWNIKVIRKAVKHHRPTSAAYDPVAHAEKSGREAYRTGDDWGLACIRAMVRMKGRKGLRSGLAYLKGYGQAKKLGLEKVVDESLERFIRRFQYNRILGKTV